ncbi:class I SAM-dependent methyltransferase [Acidiferrimicrobium sp. IK]|uniref:class I SAM-dependent methyltransferase n=1 Tax=Acidiferrimicrobium sp. IK TaxID=2871700 RepID=UPI0021CB0153|nr:class I SAM-dependent methyltransferase [Acidiferrimicrobium sp. IK]MCU4186168.1 class I SAM-dependent methyltransferase [Acidiferrimicrobium sp. IK]
MSRRCLVDAVLAHSLQPPTVINRHRAWLTGRAAGRVLDVSPRWDANWPDDHQGGRAALTVLGEGITRTPDGHPARLAGTIDGFEPPPGGFDAIVSTMAMCCAEDPPATARALAASLAPGGSLLLVEHVVGVGVTGLVQRGAAPFLAVGDGCRVDVDLGMVLRRAGLDLVEVTRFPVRSLLGLPIPFMAAAARVRSCAAGPEPAGDP